jgi:hypothetical protein
MKYFGTIELEKPQIKIKCDTDIFEWLLKYIKLMEQHEKTQFINFLN